MEVVERNEEDKEAGYSAILLQYMEKYPNFYFRSSRLAKKTGLSSQRTSKLLLALHRNGLLQRIEVGNSRKRPYYRVKL
jgi:Fic family protein